MMGGGSATQYQMRQVRSICDGILLGEEPSETPTTDNDIAMFADEMDPQCLNIVDYLGKGVRLRSRALAMTSKVEREDSKMVAQPTVHGEVGPVVSYTSFLVSVLRLIEFR